MNEAKTIFDVAKGIFGILLRVFRDEDKKHQERRQAVSNYFSILAQIIEDVAAIIRKGEYPHGKCEELLHHSYLMVGVTSDFLGKEQAEKFAAELEKAYTVEKLYDDVKDMPEEQREQNLYVLDEAAGRFRAVAALCRVSP